MTAAPLPREALYARLQEVLGDDHAAALMQHLPQEGADELATKADIRGLEARMGRFDERMGRFEERMDRFGERMDRYHDELLAQERSVNQVLRDQARTFTQATVGSIVTVAALAFGAAALI